MTDLTKIPVTVITGFLGAGKTTLIRHLMQNPQGKRLAILVNEFGTMGVDGDILKSCADENCPVENIVELANGCICCTVADDFIPTIEILMAMPQRPDHILIETSGLALPKPLLKAFDWPAIRSRITVDGVIALADAEAVAAGRFAPMSLQLTPSVPQTRRLTMKRRFPRFSRIRSSVPTLSFCPRPILRASPGWPWPAK
jgi:cobalamin biosynthesis protein CobW